MSIQEMRSLQTGQGEVRVLKDWAQVQVISKSYDLGTKTLGAHAVGSRGGAELHPSPRMSLARRGIYDFAWRCL